MRAARRRSWINETLTWVEAWGNENSVRWDATRGLTIGGEVGTVRGMNQQPSIRAVIFDMDGVLTDSEPLINAAAVAMFAERGVTVQPEDFVPFVGTGEDRYIGGVAEKYGVKLDLAAAKKRTYEIYLDLVPERLAAFPGAVELVRSCRAAGLKVAVASSADRIKIDANLRQIGLPLGEWDAIVSAEDAARKKPAPDLFLAAASRLALHPSQCVVVEDAVNGVAAAKAAGMRCVAVAQTFPAQQLQAADLIRGGIAEVKVEDLSVPTVLGTSPSPAAAPPTLAVGTSAAARPWGFWATLGMGLVIELAVLAVQLSVVFAVMVFVQITGWRLQGGGENNGLVLALAAWAAVPAAIGGCWLFASLRRGIPVVEYLGLKGVPMKTLAVWCGWLVLFVVASDLLTVSLGRPVVPESMMEAYASATIPPLLWLALIVAAPLAEETVFRGFLFKGLRHSRVGAAGAIVIPSLIWSSIHLQYDLYGIATIFVAGLLLGLARLRTGSLYVPLALHGLMNLIATVEAAWVVASR